VDVVCFGVVERKFPVEEMTMKRFAILAAFAFAFVLVLIRRHVSPQIAQSMHSRERLLHKATAPALTWRPRGECSVSRLEVRHTVVSQL
jgi:hypothetical protein